MPHERWAFGILLAATFGLRAIHPGQPIVENYVGRQIPTAMVARNLERGSGFLRPSLDSGPFPNRFLVEPPIYAQLVAWLHSGSGFVLELEPTGRLVSASAVALAGWGLYGLVRRREGPRVALLALASFSIFPVMIRYGRAFQPDALMVGCVLASLRGWDEYEAGGNWRWAGFGGFVLAAGLALKITSAWALLPFALIVRRRSIAWRLVAAGLMLMPALAWYLHAWREVRSGSPGSMAAADNASLWLGAIAPSAWLRFATMKDLIGGLVFRSFTPVGFGLMAWGLLGTGGLDRVWKGWAAGSGFSILVFATKWHHAYYWMIVAPLAAVGVARSLANLADRGWTGRWVAGILGSFLLGMAAIQAAPTWRTPPEWSGLVEAAQEVRAGMPPSPRNYLIAPEALLYYADRRGFRLEFDAEAARRAAGEWGLSLPDPARPLALVDFYRDRSAGATWRVRHVAEVGPADGPKRVAWRRAVRESPGVRILVDRPGFVFAEYP